MEPMDGVTNKSMYEEPGIKVWQWVVTGVVIIVLIIIGIMVFGSSPKNASSYDVMTQDVKNPNPSDSLKTQFQKCFDKGGVIIVPDGVLKAENLDSLQCLISNTSVYDIN